MSDRPNTSAPPCITQTGEPYDKDALIASQGAEIEFLDQTLTEALGWMVHAEKHRLPLAELRRQGLRLQAKIVDHLQAKIMDHLREKITEDDGE